MADKCPLCHSSNIRSKVQMKDGVWWYICDNVDDEHEIVLRDTSFSLLDIAKRDNHRMFYFNDDNEVSLPASIGGELVTIQKQEWV